MASILGQVAGGGADSYVASGSNVLRGGKRTYTSRTLESGWYEDRASPSFTGGRPEARTEEAIRQATVAGRRIPKYGAAILDAEERAASTQRYDAHNTVLPDTHARPSTWRSTASAAYRPGGEVADKATLESGTTFRPQRHPMTDSAKDLAEYRSRWLNQSAHGQTGRFRTEAAEALSTPVAPRFRAAQVRALPGVPKSVESLRDRLVGSGGVLALTRLRRAFAAMDDNGDGVLSREELRSGLADLSVAVSVDEFNEMFRFLDADRSGCISWREMLAVLTGASVTPHSAPSVAAASWTASAAETTASVAPELPPQRAAAVSAAWAQLCERGEAVGGGAGSLPAGWLGDQADMSAFPDVASGLRTPTDALTLLLEPVTHAALAALPASSTRSQRDATAAAAPVTAQGFTGVHRCVSPVIALDEDFFALVTRVWRAPVAVAGGPATARSAALPGARTCKILVRHRDGHKSVEDLVMGPFFDRADLAAHVRALRARGIDAAAVSLDF